MHQISSFYTNNLRGDHKDMKYYRSVSNICFIHFRSTDKTCIQTFFLSKLTQALQHISQYIILATALRQFFWMLLEICSFILTNATCSYQICLTFLQNLTQSKILYLYTVYMLTLDLLLLTLNDFRIFWQFGHSSYIYISILLCYCSTTFWWSSGFS